MKVLNVLSCREHRWIGRQLLVKVALSGFKSPWDNDGTCTFRSRSTINKMYEETVENAWNNLKKYRGRNHEWAWSSGGNEGPEKVAFPQWVSVGESCGDRFEMEPCLAYCATVWRGRPRPCPYLGVSALTSHHVKQLKESHNPHVLEFISHPSYHTFWCSTSLRIFDTRCLRFCFRPEPRTCYCASMSAKRVTWTKLFANHTSEGQTPNTSEQATHAISALHMVSSRMLLMKSTTDSVELHKQGLHGIFIKWPSKSFKSCYLSMQDMVTSVIMCIPSVSLCHNS